MSKDKQNKWFSTQKLIDEIEQLPMDELELFEEQVNVDLKKETSKNIHVPNEKDGSEINNTGQETQINDVTENDQQDQETNQRFEENPMSKDLKMPPNRSKTHVSDEETVKRNPALEKEGTTEEEEETMVKNESEEKQETKVVNEQLTVEIKKLMVENERLLAMQETWEQKRSEEIQKLTIEQETAQKKLENSKNK